MEANNPKSINIPLFIFLLTFKSITLKGLSVINYKVRFKILEVKLFFYFGNTLVTITLEVSMCINLWTHTIWYTCHLYIHSSWPLSILFFESLVLELLMCMNIWTHTVWYTCHLCIHSSWHLSMLSESLVMYEHMNTHSMIFMSSLYPYFMASINALWVSSLSWHFSHL